MRISWERYALNIASTAAERSEDIYQKVGACALNEKNMVIAVGYNGLAPGKNASHRFFHNRNHRRPFMIHAEVNCLSLIKRGEPKMLASTLLPCSSCAAMIAAYGINKVIYREVYKRDKSGLEIFDFYGIECIEYGD
jgi:dCMP deaminase